MQLGARARASLTEGYWQAEPGGFQLAGPRGVGKVEPVGKHSWRRVGTTYLSEAL